MKLCYNSVMKKFLLLCLIFPCLCACASEITEDYFDIAADYATYGKYSDAMIYVDKILQIEPNNADAKDLKNTLIRVTNPNAKSYLTYNDKTLQQAQQYKISGEKSKMIAVLANATSDFWAMFLLAQNYRDNGDYKNAISYYQKASSLKPDYSQSYLGLAKCYMAMNDYTNAVKLLNKYIGYNKNSDIAYALRAEANMNLNYLAEAEDDIKQALDIEENIAYLLIEAKILYYKGNYDTAREKLNILSRNIQTSEVYKLLGLCDYAQNNYGSALLNIDKAIILSDDDKSLNSTYNNIKLILDKQQQ